MRNSRGYSSVKALVLLAAGLMCSTGVRAEELGASVSPFPLDLKRVPPGFGKKEVHELRTLFIMLVRYTDAAVPSSEKLTSALAELKRQDCEREDECLMQLAKLAGTKYGLHASLDWNADGQVVAIGRIVGVDGKPAGPMQTVHWSKQGSVLQVARDALEELLTKLGVKKLSPS